LDGYLADWLEWSYRVREEQRQNPPAVAASLATLKKEIAAKSRSYRSGGFSRSIAVAHPTG
jgi:hypothetical protein